LGASALNANTTGTENTASGYRALITNTTGALNVAHGSGALQLNTTGSNNSAFGKDALRNNTTVSNNTAVGFSSSYSTTTGANNTAVGTYSFYTNTTGNDNVVMGHQANFYNTTGSNNTAIGKDALKANTTATQNTAVGHSAGFSNQTGENNSFLGRFAGYETTGGNNTFIGGNAGYLITSGVSNTIIGRYNGNQNNLDIRTSSGNVVLSDGTGNALYHIDSDAQHNPYRGTASSNANIVSFRSNVNGTRNGNCNIQADGDIFNLNGTYGQQSDITLKENIVDANSQWNDIKQLRIRNFSWIHDNLDAPNLIGVIAQEVQEAGMNGLIKEQQDGTLGVKYSILYTKAVKALQEAMERIETLEAKVATLEGE
jgi:hypothetical protein